MIDIDILRTQPEKVRESLIHRNKDASSVDELLAVDLEWKNYVQKIQTIREEQKKLGKEDAAKGKELKEQIKEYEQKVELIEKKRYEMILEIPNIPFDDVPIGKDESENIVLKEVGEKTKFSFEPKDHLALGEALNIIDTKTAAEVSGSRFCYLKGDAAMLEIALIHFAFDLLRKEGFEAVIPPVMIKPDVYEKMGRLTPSQQEERYFLEKDQMYLIGSAEHTMGPLHMGVTLDENQYPKRYVGFSSAFRREAGSYGKDTKGILRMHQFDKVEMYAFTTPEKSEEEHLFLRSMQEKIYATLEIPYRVVAICTGDMGPTDARQFDIEAWIPSQNTYREVASCSNTTDYQTRGISAKVKKADGKSYYAHALNATGIAIGRTIIALMENNQREDGSIAIPKALQTYLGLESIHS